MNNILNKKELESNYFFRYIQNKEKKEEIEKYLEEKKITKIIMFNEISEYNDEKYINKNEIALHIMPTINIISNPNKEKIKSLEKYGLKHKKEYALVQIDETEEETIKEKYITYFPYRNIIISEINPFADERTWEITKKAIDKINIKVKDIEEIHIKNIMRLWEARIKECENKTIRKIKDIKQEIEQYRKGYINHSKSLIETQKSLEALKIRKDQNKEEVKKELEEIKKLPFIKNITITDTLNIDIGTVYITNKVNIGNIKKQGAMVPNMKKTKVLIGNITFRIGERITITNDKNVSGYPHPHSTSEQICTGEERLHMENLLMQFKLTELTQFLYGWAFSYIPTSAHMNLQAFYNQNGGEILE